MGVDVVFMDRLVKVFDPKNSHHQTRILGVPLGDYRKLMVISEACFLNKGFLSDRKLQALIMSKLFSLGFEDV